MVRVKCVVVGDGGVGKTCMMMSYTQNAFPEQYVPTVYDNYTANVKYGDDFVALDLWDTSGQETYDRLRPLAYPGTNVVIICFSLLSQDTIDNIKEKWLPEVRQYCPHVPIILAGTKCDLRRNAMDKTTREERPVVSDSDIAKIVKLCRTKACFKCSALTFEGLADVFGETVRVAMSPDTVRRKRKCEVV